MFARVATFEGGDPSKIDEMVEQMEGEGGAPEGVPATGFSSSPTVAAARRSASRSSTPRRI
jgi:hypothetical protein